MINYTGPVTKFQTEICNSFIKLCVSLVFIALVGAGCGGGASSSNPEQQKFSNALSAYGAGNFSNAVTQFEQYLTDYPAGQYTDESRYKLGRSHHNLGEYTAARTSYNLVTSTSEWSDNAIFYLAKSHYDEANDSADNTFAFTSFDTAITELELFIANYATSGFVNEAHYYKGRSFQEQASLKQDDAALTVWTADQLFADARANFSTVQSTSVYADNAQYFKARTYQEQKPADYVNARVEYQTLVVANVSSWADDAKYQLGKTYYDEASDLTDPAIAMSGFNSAITEFEELITSSNMLYQTSNRANSARYYKGRSMHKQAKLVEADSAIGAGIPYDQYFLNARTAYQSVIDLDATGRYADNAQYQTGKTWFDEAQIALNQSNFPVMQQKLNAAITAFNIVVTNSVFQLSNSADNAYYYLGLSYHAAADIPAVDRIPITGGLDFTNTSYADARVHYETLTGTASTSPLFPSSAWIDNAYYETGNTWYSEAQSATSPLASYNLALLSYSKVLTGYPGTSIREDNSAFQLGIIYHEAGYCSNEESAFNYLVDNINTAKTSVLDEASVHLDDLAVAIITPTGTHPCVESIGDIIGFNQLSL